MRSIIILCIILSGQKITRAQLNFEGNPLTENTDYTAEESHISGRNVRQNYQRFEVADGRMVSGSRIPFALSPAGVIVTLDKHQTHISNATTKKEQLISTTTNRSALEADRLPNIKSSSDVSSKQISKSKPNESTKPKQTSENLPKSSQSQASIQKQPETRQIRQYQVHQQRHLPYESTSSQNPYKPPEQSQVYTPPDTTLQQRNVNVYDSLLVSPVNSPANQNLNQVQRQRHLPYESASSQNSYKLTQQSQPYRPADTTLQQRNVNVHHSLLVSPVNSPVSQTVNQVQQQRHLPYESTSSQNPSKPTEQSQIYTPQDTKTLEQQNVNVHDLSVVSPVISPARQALNQFLNSQTPEESQMSLQNYLTLKEQATRGLPASEPIATIQPVQNVPEQNNVMIQSVDSTTILNGYPNDEYQAYQRQENAYRQHLLSGVVPSKVVQDETVLTSYSPGQQYALPRGDNLDLQLRHNMPPFVGPARQRPRHRGQISSRFRGRPWAQSRIDPRPFAYNHKGPIYGGPPGPPPGFLGKWKPPVEVIYTRPPGFGHGPSHPSNPPVSYEDASHWFPDADEAPPHKDVYYSQLYQQSYDPHYYNYIAKTGKIKPWLYGKLGKHENKSIWWELFAGFKKHGMKNMMNPMFLLGMTIPTLTIMLTALVQKKSFGRSDSASHITEEVIDELVQRIQQHIACYERQIKNEEGSEEKCW